MYELIYESPEPVGPMQGSWRWLFYLRHWDAFLAITSTHYARLFRDGTIVFFGRRSGSLEPLGAMGGTVAYWGQNGEDLPLLRPQRAAQPKPDAESPLGRGLRYAPHP
jgi:hypothetical protein